MKTRIEFGETRDNDNAKILWTDDELIDHLIAKDFREGIVTLEFPKGDIDDISAMLLQLFKPESGFPEAIGKIFRKREEKVKAIEFELRGVKVSVTEDTCDEICEKWAKGLLDEVKKKAKMKADLKNINEILASIEFLRRPGISEQEIKETKIPQIVTKSCNWAKLMQYLSSKYGKSIADVKDMSAEAIGMSSMERVAMLFVLKVFWKYGDELDNELDEIVREWATMIELSLL